MFKEIWMDLKIWLTKVATTVETYDLVEIESMTKLQLDKWAESKGVKLDRRMKKTDMLKELKKHFNIV